MTSIPIGTAADAAAVALQDLSGIRGIGPRAGGSVAPVHQSHHLDSHDAFHWHSISSQIINAGRRRARPLAGTTHVRPGHVVKFEFAKARVCSSFNNHNCSGTASQVTPQGCQQHANATCVKVGFELSTDGIQFYV